MKRSAAGASPRQTHLSKDGLTDASQGTRGLWMRASPSIGSACSSRVPNNHPGQGRLSPRGTGITAAVEAFAVAHIGTSEETRQRQNGTIVPFWNVR